MKNAAAPTYTVQIARVTDLVIVAHVTGGRTPYVVRLAPGTQGSVFCSCPHSAYRGAVCKHAAAVVAHLDAAFEAAIEAALVSGDFALIDAPRELSAMAGAWLQNAQAAYAARKVA